MANKYIKDLTENLTPSLSDAIELDDGVSSKFSTIANLLKVVSTSNTNGWAADANTWSYSSVDSPTGVISINADMTSNIQKGMRIKYNQDQALTAYFPFDVNSTSTVGSFTSADQNTPTYSAGKFSNALTLVAASSQAVNITDTALMKPTGEFTIGAWIKTSTLGTDKIIMQSFNVVTNWYGWDFAVTANNKISMQIGLGSSASAINIIGTTSVTDGNWHYVVATYRNNYAQVYVDGVLEASGYSPAPSYNATNYVRIGCLCIAGSNSLFFNGQIDDLFIINGYALDEETIKAKYLASTAQGTSAITVTKKAIVTNVGAWSGSAQLITAYHGTDFNLANATISSPYYSNVKIPFGFNTNPDKWSVFYQNSVTASQASSVQYTWYNISGTLVSVPIGIWSGSYAFKLQTGTAGTYTMATSFSTNNAGAETNNRFTAGSTFVGLYTANWIYKSFPLITNAKTSYYLNQRTTDAGTPTIIMENATIPCVISLVSSYL